VFRITKVGTVAGCYVLDGLSSVPPGCACCATTWWSTGELESLKRFKDDVKEVKAGFECGLNLKNFNDIEEGDQLDQEGVRLSKLIDEAVESDNKPFQE
jgi:translation initiation factor IF-2